MKHVAIAFFVVALLACGLPKDSALCGPNGTDTCSSLALVCNFAVGCAQCEVDADCNGTLGKPVCLEGTCVECAVNGDCDDTSTCWADHACHAPCTTGGCPNGIPICATRTDEGDAVCLQCQSNVDCEGTLAAPVCDYQLGTCVECVLDSECSTAKPKCLGDRCVECKQNSDCPNGGTCTPLTFTCSS